MDDAPHLPARQRNAPPRASALLRDLEGAFPNETVTVHELIERLEGRAIGLLLLILALPMCIPNVPGISTIFGLLIIAPAVQMILGGQKLWLPGRVRRWSFPREGLLQAIRVAAPILERIEHFVKPRMPVLTQPPFTIFFGLQTLLMAFVLVLPIPLGNWPPGMTVAMTALALLQRDGLLMLLSAPAAVISVLIAYIGVRLGWVIMRELGELMVSWGAALQHILPH